MLKIKSLTKNEFGRPKYRQKVHCSFALCFFKCISRKMLRQKLKTYSDTASKNKSVESTQFTDLLGKTFGPLGFRGHSVDKHRSTSYRIEVSGQQNLTVNYPLGEGGATFWH